MSIRRMNGFDAYENAWDVMAKHLWNLLGYNLVWFAGFVMLLFLIFFLTVSAFDSWAAFLILTFFMFFVIPPVWEAANIARYRNFSPTQSTTIPIARILVARLLFLVLVCPAYVCFILPGIYLHCRFSLYLPILVSTPGISPLGSLTKSWTLTRARFVDFYTLWIAVVVSKPVCLLPFGLGFLLERPASGLAKHFMCISCTNRSRDGPP